MRRLLKLTISLAGCVLALGLTVFGGQFSSYLRTAAGSVEESVRDTVPIEFELRRARDLIDDILPELKSQIRHVALEEVQIARLDHQIDDLVSRRKQQRDQLAQMRQRSEKTLVSLNGTDELSTSSSSGVDPQVMSQRFESLKHLDANIQSDRELMRRREESLAAAMVLLEKSTARKQQLEQKVEALAAQHRLIQSRQVEHRCGARRTSLRDAEALLMDLEVRLRVADRVLAHQDRLDQNNVARIDGVDAETLVSEIDAYLSR